VRSKTDQGAGLV